MFHWVRADIRLTELECKNTGGAMMAERQCATSDAVIASAIYGIRYLLRVMAHFGGETRVFAGK